MSVIEEKDLQNESLQATNIYNSCHPRFLY